MLMKKGLLKAKRWCSASWLEQLSFQSKLGIQVLSIIKGETSYKNSLMSQSLISTILKANEKLLDLPLSVE